MELDILDKIYAGLKLKDAVYKESTNTCTVNFLYNPEMFTLDEDKKKVLYNKLVELVGDFVKFELSFVRCPLDKRAIANHTYTTVVNNFPALSKNFSFDDVSVEIDGMRVSVTLQLTPTVYEYAKGVNRETLVSDKLQESFLADFVVSFVLKEDEIVATSYIERNIELMESIKPREEKTVYNLSEIANIIGDNNYSVAIDYSKVNSPIENIVLCGEVTSIQRRSYKRKVTKNNETKEIERAYYSFSIKNEGKVLYCSIFPKQTDEAKGDLIEVGMKVCCYGSFREYNGKLNFTANTIARCVYSKNETISQFKHVNEEYHTVFPQEYVDYEQADLFSEVGKSFDGTYVVFDLETTGLDGNKDEIIEIGACKIIEGRISEVFSTFVNPNRHIPNEITELTGINDAMVENAPSINYVLPDFYKFCDGATLVAHNIQFDISFVHAAGKKYSYNFDHPQKDTMIMSRERLKGLKNYKLGTIVEYLGVTLENAHRAVHDATATAKVFIKLMQNY